MSLKSEINDEYQERERERLVCEKHLSEEEARHDPDIQELMETIDKQRRGGWY